MKVRYKKILNHRSEYSYLHYKDVLPKKEINKESEKSLLDEDVIYSI